MDDTLFEDCEVSVPVPLGACGVGEEQCASGECFPAGQLCDFEKDCCDSSDEQIQSCRKYTHNMFHIRKNNNQKQEHLESIVLIVMDDEALERFLEIA